MASLTGAPDSPGESHGTTAGQNRRPGTYMPGRDFGRELNWTDIVTLVIFVCSISVLAYSAWIADQAPVDEPLLPLWFAHTVQYFAPFAWGALGSCVYILKRISDEAAANRFDPDKFQGWQARALLGAVLGGTITYIIDPTAFGSATISDTAIAFLAGLGTKDAVAPEQLNASCTVTTTSCSCPETTP